MLLVKFEIRELCPVAQHLRHVSKLGNGRATLVDFGGLHSSACMVQVEFEFGKL